MVPGVALGATLSMGGAMACPRWGRCVAMVGGRGPRTSAHTAAGSAGAKGLHALHLARQQQQGWPLTPKCLFLFPFSPLQTIAPPPHAHPRRRPAPIPSGMPLRACVCVCSAPASLPALPTQESCKPGGGLPHPASPALPCPPHHAQRALTMPACPPRWAPVGCATQPWWVGVGVGGAERPAPPHARIPTRNARVSER